MAVALGLLAGAEAQTDDASRLNELLVDGDAVVRWGAAVALVRLLPQAPPEPAVRELLGWLTSEAAPERDPEILFCDPQDYALLVVRSVPVLRERAVGAILDRLPALSGTAALSPCGTWCSLPSKRTIRSSRWRSRSCLRCSSGCCGPWWTCQNFGGLKGIVFPRQARAPTHEAQSPAR
jgi:hypothetical protein